MSTETRHQIEVALQSFAAADLRAASIGLLNTLGYQSDKILDIDNTPTGFLAEFDKRDRKFRQDKALFERWKSVDFLFQITDDEVRAGAQSALDFDSGYDPGNYQSYLFFAIDLEKNHYTRTQLSDITREINLLFDMPAMLLMRHNGSLTFSIIDRRLHKKDQSHDVLEKVRLIKDIRYQNPHRAHIEILHDLSLQALIAKHKCKDFKELHKAWRTTLDTKELNKKFYRELSDWYFWALNHVEFPDDVEKDEATRNATNVIRLLTRLIFCWFLKEKGLIPAGLFREDTLTDILKSLKDDESTFYLAILQNLFFGTLNQRMNVGHEINRKFTSDGSFHKQKDEYGVKNLYRYQKKFSVAEEEAIKLFESIPFLNGGLFDCLDKEDDTGKVIYVDGFTRKIKKQPKVPNYLFFSDYRTLDLSGAYGDKKRKKEKVRGLINLLDGYKFTVTENTPIEEEIALDPELLGKVFENLLASYNPETGTTARKQTGSFYTPREIVNYMVDESLIAYLEGQLKANVPRLAKMKDLQGILREVFAYTEKDHPFDEEEVEALINAIDRCKILDPACGSGAFPMGVLHKLVYILAKLDPHNERWKRKQLEKLDSISMREELERTFRDNDDDYGRKLYLIENSIYGVDIQPIAIQISKLRFFISLICDQRTNKNKAKNCGVRPLPNLETKFVAANTLIPLYHKGLLLLPDSRVLDLERELKDLRHKHFAAQRRRDKLALQKRDTEIRERIAVILASRGMSGEASHQLATWDPYDQNTSAPFFDSECMFGIKDGFDVVIGNPPYARIQVLQQTQPEFVPFYRKNFSYAQGSFDIYILFLERGFGLLKMSGVLNYILPHKFFQAKFGSLIREKMSKAKAIRQIVRFGAEQVFDSATTYTCLLWLSKAPQSNFFFVEIKSLVEPNEVFAALSRRVESSSYVTSLNEMPSSDSWGFYAGPEKKIIQKITDNTVTLGNITRKIFQGIATGADKIFVLKTLSYDKGIYHCYSKQLDAEVELEEGLVKPFMMGKDVRRYQNPNPVNIVIFPYLLAGQKPKLMPQKLIQNNFPRGWAYLLKNKKILTEREHGRFTNCWYCFSRPQNLTEFSSRKILTAEIAHGCQLTIDLHGTIYHTTKVYGFVFKENVTNKLKYFLGVLNSKILWFFIKNTGYVLRGGYYTFKTEYLRPFPIPCSLSQNPPTERQQTAIEERVK